MHFLVPADLRGQVGSRFLVRPLHLRPGDAARLVSAYGQSTSWLFSQGEYLGTIQVGGGFLRQVYDITLYHDTHPGSTGLVFYRADLVDYPVGREVDRALRDMKNVAPWYVLPTLGNWLSPEK